MKKVLLISILLYSVSLLGQNILISEDFEGNGLPAGWTIATNATDGGWNMGTAQNLESDWWSIAEHGNIIGTNDDDCDCDKSMDYLITPPLDLSNSVAAALQFENYYDGGEFQGNTEVATLEYSLDNGASWTIISTIEGTDDGAWDLQSFDLSSLAGNANVLLGFHYDDVGGWMFGWAIDDILIFEPEGLDLALTSSAIPSNVNVPAIIPVAGVVSNLGAETISSFDLSWDIGGSMSYTTSFTNISIPSLGAYNFTHPDNLEIFNSGQTSLQLTISNVNGSAQDDNASNDVFSMTIQALEYGTIIDGGIERDYIYYHPSSAPENCPLVFVCHGYTGTAQGIMNYSGFNQLADQYGFAVCYPQGTQDGGGNTFFNVGYEFQNNETVDDVAFLQNLNTYFQNTYSLASDKVFCTGMSNGGDLCYMLACEASETFRAVAPVAGMIMQNIMDDCTPSNEVSILEIHGTNDNVTYFGGDPTNQDGWGAYPSIPATMNFFNNMFDLTLQSSENLPNINPNDGSTVLSEKYGAENSCTEVWLYTVQGGGHDWPGAYGNMDIEASREAWLFFEQLCAPTSDLSEITSSSSKEVIRVLDLMGREVKKNTTGLVLYQYSDGSSERIFVNPH